MTKIDHTEARNSLRDAILETARWRRERAAEFPYDPRNLAAAENLETISVTIDAVPDSLIQAYAEAWDEARALKTSEAQSELLRSIGFGSLCTNAARLIEKLTSPGR